MTYQCRLLDEPQAYNLAQPGDMWLMPDYLDPDDLEFMKRQIFSPEYMRDWMATRPPIMVSLPGGHVWCVDQRGSGSSSGWTVTGTAPNITATPSILVDNYHGWLKDGVLSDDLEGRTYQEKSNAR